MKEILTKYGNRDIRFLHLPSFSYASSFVLVYHILGLFSALLQRLSDRSIGI